MFSYFDDYFLGMKQPVVYSCLFMCSGSILAIEYIDGRSKRKKCDVDSLESLSYLLKCIQFNLARELGIIFFKERLNFEK